MSSKGYDLVSSDETLSEKELNQPLHRRKCCPYSLRSNGEFSALLWADFPRALYSIALLVMFYWENLTPITTPTTWFILLLTYSLINLIFLLAASSLSGMWYQKGKAIERLFDPYLDYIICQFLSSVFITASIAYINWFLCPANPLDLDTTFQTCHLVTPIKYKSFTIWGNAIAVFVSVQIVCLGKLFHVYLIAAITRIKK